MASVSGFDVLAESLEALPSVELVSVRRGPLAVPKKRDLNWLVRKLGFHKASSMEESVPITPFWNPGNRDLTRRALAALEASPSDTLLLLMAVEDQYDPLLLTIPDKVRRRIVVVAHQPPAWYRLNWRDFSALDGLGGVVCLSRSQKDFFAAVACSPLLQIKHGVKADYFCPNSALRVEVENRLLFVGQWLRDFELLERAMQIVWARQPETKLDCVVPRASRSHPALYRLARDARVSWHADLNPDALRSIYQRATLLFLPLLDSTANNAIIEALASGLPVVSTQVGGAGEYVTSEAGELCTVGDALSHADAILRWLDEPNSRTLAGTLGRSFAVRHLDWNLIASDLVFQLEETCT